ncbi:MAG: hypothetical protein M5U26_15740 [Planctomycetota bacterium]|nr:hypothetical protein [Planctomycetota bacterium]
MTIEEVKTLLATTPLERMDAAVRLEVEAYLSLHPELRQETEFDRFIEEGLRPLRPQGMLSPAVLNRLQAGARSASRRKSRRQSSRAAERTNRWALPLAAAAGLLVAAGVWYLASVTPRAPQEAEASKPARPAPAQSAAVEHEDPEATEIPSKPPVVPRPEVVQAPQARPDGSVQAPAPNEAPLPDPELIVSRPPVGLEEHPGAEPFKPLSGRAETALAQPVYLRLSDGRTDVEPAEADLRFFRSEDGQNLLMTGAGAETGLVKLYDLGGEEKPPRKAGVLEAVPLEAGHVYLVEIARGNLRLYAEIRAQDFSAQKVSLDWLGVPREWALTRVMLAQELYEEALAEADLERTRRELEQPKQKVPPGGLLAKPEKHEGEKTRKAVKPLGNFP